MAGVQYSETYGKDYTDGYIQIHHIKPLSKNEGEVDPGTDLVPLRQLPRFSWPTGGETP